MITITKLKPWGSSLGIVVPNEIIKAEHLKEGEEIIIEIKKKHSLKKVFGTLKNWKINSQQVKDELRKEWE